MRLAIAMVVVAAHLVLVAPHSYAEGWVCRPVSSHFCEPGKGCRDGSSVGSTYFRITGAASGAVYHRCDSKGCDQHATARQPSGLFTIYPTAAGSLLKMTSDGSSFVDVATILDSVVIYFGSCSAQ